MKKVKRFIKLKIKQMPYPFPIQQNEQNEQASYVGLSIGFPFL